MINLPGSRIADDDIYLLEDRRREPKNIFVEAARIINHKKWQDGTLLLDVGCATGEFINYLKMITKKFDYVGLDISTKMIAEAINRDATTQFIIADALDAHSFPAKKANIITMFGVMNCSDDPVPVINNLIGWAKEGGMILILDMINDESIDVLTRYRRANQHNALWESGWNMFSRSTLEKILSTQKRIQSYRFQPFILPFKLSKKDDPMRTWTMATEVNPYQLINGAGQLVNLEFIIIDMVP